MIDFTRKSNEAQYEEGHIILHKDNELKELGKVVSARIEDNFFISTNNVGQTFIYRIEDIKEIYLSETPF